MQVQVLFPALRQVPGSREARGARSEPCPTCRYSYFTGGGYNEGMSVDLQEYVTVAEAARLIGRTPGIIRRYIALGLLPAERVGRLTWLIPRESVRTFVPPPRGNPAFRSRKSL